MLIAAKMLFIKEGRPVSKRTILFFHIKLYHTIRNIPEKDISGIVHFQRIKNHIPQCLIYRFFTYGFDNSGGQLAGEAIKPVRARLEGKWSISHCPDLFPKGIVPFFPEGFHTVLHALKGKVCGRGIGITVRKSAFHGEGIADCDRMFRRNDIDIAVCMTDVFFACGPFRKKCADGI